MSDLTVDEIEGTVLGVLSDVLGEPPGALSEHPVLAAHAWDSLTTLEALAQLESGFGVQLELRAFHAARTVEDLTSLIAAGLAGRDRGGR
jgi:acyl carrier protein